MELPRALRELQEARDASRSLQCFGQIASIARDLPSSQDLFPLSVRFEIDPHLGVKLLGEMKRALGKSANNKRQLWKVFGQLLFWGFELHRLGHGRANDVQFETQLNLVLEFAWGESELLLPHHLDTFFAKAIAQSRTTGSRLGEAVDSCLERFLSKPTSSLELQFDPFCRSVVLRAPRTSLLPVLRCVAGRVYTQSLEPVLVRLLSFLLGTLDFTGEGGELEHQAAAECIRGDFNLVRVASEALLQSRGTTALEEETGLVQLVSKLFVCVAPKWQLLLERTSNAVAIEYASCMELVLTKLCKAKRQAEPALVSSLTRAVAVILATASPLASSAGTTIQTFKQQADEENQLLLCALRVNFALCFHTDSPQSELFGLPLHNGKLGCSAALVYLLLLALGFEPNTNAATTAEGHFEQFLFQRLKRVLGESETLVLWSAGEFALQMHSGAFPAAESWHFSFTLAARRVRDLQRPKTAAQDKLELLFRAFHGLQEVRSSIRHLQDLGWFYIAFGKRQGFSIAAERFLGDVAKTLFDLKRYWECGNVYVMLGTCDLACKRYTGSSHHFALASDAFDKLGLHRESHKVRLASRVFAKQSLFPREWDWCLTNGHGDSSAASFAHYFLVGAVGLGDADLTVVRIVLSSWHLYELAFDEAVRYLESGSYRRCIAGQLRWDTGGVAKFFPSEVVGQDEFGFWIQRVWPGMGEEDAVEHCCGKWGVVGEPLLVIEVKDQRRGLNALISACSVLVDVAPLPGLELDVPVDWDTGDIPLPLQPPPPPASANHSYFPSNESVSFHDSAVAGNVSFLPDDSFGEEEIRPPGSPPPSELDIAPPSSPPPPQSSSLLSAITPPDAVSEAEQRKREFRRRREQENLLLQQQQEEAARMQREEALKQERKEEKRLRKEQEALQQEEEAAKRARSEAKRKQLVEQAAAAEALQRQQDEILRQQEDAERLRAEHRLRQQQQREAEEQFALKQQLEAQYFAEQQSRLQEQQSRLLQEQQSRLFQEQQSQEQIQLEVEQEHQRLQEQKRMLKQRQQQQQQSFNTTFEALPTAADTSNPMLIFKRKQQLQSPPQHSFEQQSTTPPKSSGSFSRRVVLLPTANNNNTSTNLEDVLQRSSPPKNLFNVNGAKVGGGRSPNTRTFTYASSN